MTSSVSVPWWAALSLPLIAALIGLLGNYLSARLQRRTGAETVEAMRNSTNLTRSAVEASSRSADAARSAAETADRAAQQLHKFRLHDDTMRSLYWAADHAIATESNRALLGLEVLGAFAEQSHKDTNTRAGRIVSATDAAIRKVATPTFLAVLAKAASDGTSTEGHIRASAVEIIAARLLLAHSPDLDQDLRIEIEAIAHAVPGSEIAVDQLHTGRHVEREQAVQHELETEVEHELELGL